METEDSSLVTLFQLPPKCSEECLQSFFEFVRNTIMSGLRITVMVKRPVDIEAKVQAALDARRKRLQANKTPEEILRERKENIVRLIEEGTKHRDKEEYPQAIKLFSQAYAEVASFPEAIEQTIRIMVLLAYAFEKNKDNENAYDFQQKCVSMIERQEGELLEMFAADLKVFRILKINRTIIEGQDCFNTEQYDAALKKFELALTQYKVYADEFPNKIIELHKLLSKTHEQLEAYAISVSYLLDALPMVDNLIDEKIFILNNLGRVYKIMGDLDRTIIQWDLCINTIKEKGQNLEESDSILIETLLFDIGVIHFSNLRPNQAIEYIEGAVQLGKSIYGPEDMRVGDKSIILGDVYKSVKKWELALEAYTVTMNIRKKHYSDQSHISVAKTISLVGQILLKMKKYEAANNILAQAINQYNILDKRKENQAIQLSRAGLLILQSECYKAMLELDGCVSILSECIKIRQQYLGNENPQTQQSFQLLIQVHFNLNEPDKALERLIELETIQYKQYGSSNLIVAHTCQNIAIASCQVKDFDKAMNYSKKAITIFKKLGGVQDPNLKKAQDKYEEIKKLASMEQQQSPAKSVKKE